MKTWQVVAIGVAMSAAAVLVITFGTLYVVPDLVRVNYGFPFTWVWNTLSTIAGPVNIWNVNIVLLAADLVVWLAGVFLVTSYLLIRLRG